MKNRWLFIGVVAFLVLGYLALQKRGGPAPRQGAEPDAGQHLLSFDINDVARFEFVSPSSTSTLMRLNGQWTAADLWNYPADFAKVSEPLRALATLKAGPIVRGGTELLDELGMADDPAKSGEQRPGFLRLFDDSGKLLALVTIGQRRMADDMESARQSGGRYVRIDDGPVMLVNEEFYGLASTPTEWIDTILLNVPASDIQSITVTATASTYTIRSPADGQYELDGLQPDQEVAKETAGRMFQALVALPLALIVDPAKPEAELGLEKPEEFQAVTRDGVTWVIHVGGSPDGVNRYARLFGFYKQPEPPAAPAEGADEAAKKAYEQAKKDYDEKVARLTKEVADKTTLFSKWTYVLPNYTCATLLTDRSQLVRPVQKAETAQPESAQPESAEASGG
jgi:hypothetical protein